MQLDLLLLLLLFDWNNLKHGWLKRLIKAGCSFKDHLFIKAHDVMIMIGSGSVH